MAHKPFIYSFSVFTYAPEARELRRNDRRLRISEQSARLLELLLEAEGALVSRTAMRKALWPDGAPLDYDHAINKAVSQLRMILRDRPKSPSLIETISKRGYRFITPLDRREKDSPAVSVPAPAPAPEPIAISAIPPAPMVLDRVSVLHLGAQTVLQASSLPPRPTLRSTRQSRWSRVRRFWLAGTAVLALVCVFAFFYLQNKASRAGAAAHPLALGIAPFETADSTTAPLAESLRMDLIDAVTQLPGIEVRAAHSFRSNARDHDSVRALAESLDLDEILFATLRVNGDSYELRLELVRGRDATHQGFLVYRGKINKINEVRDKLRNDIAQRLESNPASKSLAAFSASTPSAEAYQHYLLGRQLLAERVDSSLHRAISEFEQAEQLDPKFARAYAAQANASMVLAEHSTDTDSRDYQQADTLTQKALSLDPNLAEAIALQGYIAFRAHWQFALADERLRRAIELEPGQASYHIWYAVLLTTQAQFDAAFHQLDLARVADPFWPALYITESFTANAARQPARAHNAAQRVQELMPNWALPWNCMAWAAWSAGRYEEAIQDWRRMAEIEHDQFRMRFEDKGLAAYRRGGVPAYARLRLDLIAHHADKVEERNDFDPAEWYAYANEPEKALAELRADLAAHRPEILQMGLNPAFDRLHDLPDYQALLHKVGLPLPSNR